MKKLVVAVFALAIILLVACTNNTQIEIEPPTENYTERPTTTQPSTMPEEPITQPEETALQPEETALQPEEVTTQLQETETTRLLASVTTQSATTAAQTTTNTTTIAATTQQRTNTTRAWPNTTTDEMERNRLLFHEHIDIQESYAQQAVSVSLSC